MGINFCSYSCNQIIEKVVNINQVPPNQIDPIIKSLPERDKTDLKKFKEVLKDKVNNLDDEKKAKILFLWICENIAYDDDSFFSGKRVECEPEAVFRNGKTLCSGYARLFKNIGEYMKDRLNMIN